MKSSNRYCLIASLALFMLSMCKNPDISYEAFNIAFEKIEPETYGAKISGIYDFPGGVKGISIKIGREETLIDAVNYPMEINDKVFSIRIDSLDAGTTYYYCYDVDFGHSTNLLTETNNFKTLLGAPSVETIEAIAIDSLSFRIKCKVTSNGGSPITERGVCWNSYGDPTIEDHHMSHSQNEMGEYYCYIGELTYNTTYYVRAYAINDIGTNYGNAITITTLTPASLPIVTTDFIVDITTTSATCHGTVVSEGSSPVTRRGFCWSTEHNPTIEDLNIDSGNGIGSFSASLTGLTPGQLYYVRAYAISNNSPSYGSEMSFSTLSVLPVVTTLDVTDITHRTAIAHGKVNNAQNFTIIRRGICWSTNPHPTLSDHPLDSPMDTDEFSVEINSLSPHTRYYVRAFVTISSDTIYGDDVSFETEAVGYFSIQVSANPVEGGTVSGNGIFTEGSPCTISAIPNDGYRFLKWTEDGSIISDNPEYTFTVLSNRSFVAHFVSTPTGAIDGMFTVDPNHTKVWFSQGNLQYIGSASTPYWRFAANQWDCLGKTTGQNSSSQNVDRDLFGWGTSGWYCGNTYFQPWDSDKRDGSMYGPPGSFDLTGNYANSDWGYYNPISNGGNTTQQWRTLTYTELNYVFNLRSASTVNGVPNARYTKAQVAGVYGVILFPDSYTHPNGVELPVGINDTGNTGWDGNNYIAEKFRLMQDAGAVFLPAAGYRTGTDISDENRVGNYWTASTEDNNNYQAWMLRFNNNWLYTDQKNYRYGGQSVRLVKTIQ